MAFKLYPATCPECGQYPTFSVERVSTHVVLARADQAFDYDENEVGPVFWETCENVEHEAGSQRMLVGHDTDEEGRYLHHEWLARWGYYLESEAG